MSEITKSNIGANNEITYRIKYWYLEDLKLSEKAKDLLVNHREHNAPLNGAPNIYDTEADFEPEMWELAAKGLVKIFPNQKYESYLEREGTFVAVSPTHLGFIAAELVEIERETLSND